MLHRHFLLLPIRQGYEDLRTKTVLSRMGKFGTPHRHRDPNGKQLENLMRILGSSRYLAFWENSEAPLPPPRRRCNLIHPEQLSPLPERLKLPYPDGEILSGYEEDVSFIRDRCTTWVKADPNDTLERHVVDVRKGFAEYREASARRQEAPAQEYFFDSSVPNRSSVQKRLIFLHVSECDIVPLHFTARTTRSDTVLVDPSLRDVLSPDLSIPGRTVLLGVRRSAHNAIQGVLAVAVTLWQPADRSAALDARECPSKCSSVSSILLTQAPSSQRGSTLLEKKRSLSM